MFMCALRQTRRLQQTVDRPARLPEAAPGLHCHVYACIPDCRVCQPLQHCQQMLLQQLGSQALTFMGFLLTPLTLTAFLSAVYSLLWRRASMAVFRLPTKALWEMTLLGNSFSWLTMIAPCTTTKRSTALICREQPHEHCKRRPSNWVNAKLALLE